MLELLIKFNGTKRSFMEQRLHSCIRLLIRLHIYTYAISNHYSHIDNNSTTVIVLFLFYLFLYTTIVIYFDNFYVKQFKWSLI